MTSLGEIMKKYAVYLFVVVLAGCSRPAEDDAQEQGITRSAGKKPVEKASAEGRQVRDPGSQKFNVMDFFKPGKVVKFKNGTSIYVGSKQGNKLHDLKVVEKRSDGQVKRFQAKSAVVTESDDLIIITMTDTSIEILTSAMVEIGNYIVTIPKYSTEKLLPPSK